MRACGCVCCMPPNGQLSKFGFGQKSRVSSLMFSFRMRQGRAESFSWAFSPPIPCVLTRMLVESKMRTSNCTPNQKRQIGKKQTGPRLSRSPDFGQEHNNLVFYLTRCKGTAIPTRGQYLLLGILRQRTDFFALTRAHVYSIQANHVFYCHLSFRPAFSLKSCRCPPSAPHRRRDTVPGFRHGRKRGIHSVAEPPEKASDSLSDLPFGVTDESKKCNCAVTRARDASRKAMVGY